MDFSLRGDDTVVTSERKNGREHGEVLQVQN
jgi:hypothetical protein